jgi:hypothetical protein
MARGKQRQISAYPPGELCGLPPESLPPGQIGGASGTTRTTPTTGMSPTCIRFATGVVEVQFGAILPMPRMAWLFDDNAVSPGRAPCAPTILAL